MFANTCTTLSSIDPGTTRVDGGASLRDQGGIVGSDFNASPQARMPSRINNNQPDACLALSLITWFRKRS